MEDGLIITEKRDPQSLRVRVEHYENPHSPQADPG